MCQDPDLREGRGHSVTLGTAVWLTHRGGGMGDEAARHSGAEPGRPAGRRRDFGLHREVTEGFGWPTYTSSFAF